LCNDDEELEEDDMSTSTSLIATRNGAKEENQKLIRMKSYDMKIGRTKIILRV
jgi:hypothetical protein